MANLYVKGLTGLALAGALAGCADTGRDAGFDNHDLSTLAATIWVDPDGCKHWVIDDGIEGYMSPVLKLDGTPDCV